MCVHTYCIYMHTLFADPPLTKPAEASAAQAPVRPCFAGPRTPAPAEYFASMLLSSRVEFPSDTPGGSTCLTLLV